MFRIRFPIREIAQGLQKAQTRLAQRQPELLQILGVQLLGFVKIAYEEKGKGRTGSDGIRWDPLKASTIERKNRRARPKNRKGKRTGKPKATTKSGKKRPGLGESQIGVDSGLQRASAAPGYKAPDGRGGNVMEIEGAGITVGFGREYSEHFDDKRKLIPDKLPDEWQKELEGTVSDWAGQVINEEGII